MKRFGVALLLISVVMVGCNRNDHTEARHVNVIHREGAIEIQDTPKAPSYNPEVFSLVSYIGNITFHSRLQGLDDSTGCILFVYIKRSETTGWEQLQMHQNHQGIPMYTYDPIVHEIRWQNCVKGWGYNVYILNPIQSKIL